MKNKDNAIAIRPDAGELLERWECESQQISNALRNGRIHVPKTDSLEIMDYKVPNVINSISLCWLGDQLFRVYLEQMVEWDDGTYLALAHSIVNFENNQNSDRQVGLELVLVGIVFDEFSDTVTIIDEDSEYFSSSEDTQEQRKEALDKYLDYIYGE